MTDEKKPVCDCKHTKYQPTNEEFKCPKCGAPAGEFYVDESPNLECDKLHPDDYLVCAGKGGQRCDYSTTGRAFAAALQKKHDLVPCEHCKGTGLVKKGK